MLERNANRCIFHADYTWTQEYVLFTFIPLFILHMATVSFTKWFNVILIFDTLDV